MQARRLSPLAGLVAVLAVALPWLDPFAGGPSAAVQPWLFSAICAAVLCLSIRGASLPGPLAGGCLAVAVWAFMRSGASLETLALAGGLAVVLLAAAAARGVPTPQWGDLFAAAWLAAAIASTCIALAQYFGVAHVFGPFASPSATGEAYANLRQRNQFATLTAIGIAAALYFAGRKENARDVRLWLVVGVLAIGNVATTSRTGLLELVVLLGLSVIWTRRLASAPVQLGAFGIGTYFAASFMLPLLHRTLAEGPGQSIWERVAAGESCSSRTVLWSNVAELVARRPWAGWGWGELDYAHYAHLYPGPRFCDILDNAHNLPLHLAVELGLPAALLFVAAIVAAIWRNKPWREPDSRRRLAYSVLAVIALHSLLEYPLWYGPFQIAAGVAVGLLASPPGGAVLPRAGASLLAVGLAAAVVYAAWDYRRVSQIYVGPEDRLPAYQQDTVGKVARSWLFRPQARFAELTLAPLDRGNAQWTWDTAQALLHYSPEPKIIEKAIESAALLGREDDALWHLARYRAAFPQAQAEWAAAQRHPLPILPSR